jgi:thiamine pyrophosphokinase
MFRQMARDADVAKFLNHIRTCRNACLPGGRLGFFIGKVQVGYVLPEFGANLAALSRDFTLTDRVALAPAATSRLNEIAAAAGCPMRGEDFEIREHADGPSLGVLDRGAVPKFGVIGAGVHVNGLVHRSEGWHLWVGRRAPDKKLDPNKLDNLVGGGVTAGHTPLETLLKEGQEEAMLPEALAKGASLVGRIAYDMEREEGLRRDVLYLFDLVLPEDFVPRPADGEVAHFELWSLARVVETVRETDEFKFNVNLVLIDLFLRLGLIEGSDATLLRRALDGDSSALAPHRNDSNAGIS